MALNSRLLLSVAIQFGVDPSQNVIMTQKFVAMSLPNILVTFPIINLSDGDILVVLEFTTRQIAVSVNNFSLNNFLISFEIEIS
jgi:hypothetical protein